MIYTTFEEWQNSADYKELVDAVGDFGYIHLVAEVAWSAGRKGTEAEVFEKLNEGIK